MTQSSAEQNHCDPRWVELKPDHARAGVTSDSVLSYHSRLMGIAWMEVARAYRAVDATGPVAVFMIVIDGTAADFWEARLQVEAEAADALALDLFGVELAVASGYLSKNSPRLAEALNPKSIPPDRFAVIVCNKAGTSVCYRNLPRDDS